VATSRATDGVSVYGTPWGFGRAATHGRRMTTDAPEQQRDRVTREGWAEVAGQPKRVLVRPNHGRGIGPKGTAQSDPHDALSTVRDKVKRTELRELRADRVECTDRRNYERSWVTLETEKRNQAQVDGSSTVLAAARGKHGPLGHGPSIITRETRDMIDALRKELGLDVTMTAQEVIVEARQQFKLEDIELPLAADAERLLQALRRGGVKTQAAGMRGGSYSIAQISTRPLR
jgi:hypothetical protein